MKSKRPHLTTGGPDLSAHEAVAILQLPIPGFYAVRASLHTYAFPRHFHDEYHITILLHGAQASTAARGIREIQRVGEVKFAEPGEVHDGTPVDHQVRTYWTLYVEPEAFTTISEDIGQSGKNFNWRTGMVHNPELFRQLMAMFDAIKTGVSALTIETGVFRAVAYIGQTDVTPPSHVPRTLPAGLSYARQMIDDDPAAPLRLDDLARAAGLTRHQIVHGFQRLIGLPPHTYQIQRRVSLGMRRIQAGRPLVEAAIEAGFSDQAHMTRTFRAILGVTPGAFQPARSRRLVSTGG